MSATNATGADPRAALARRRDAAWLESVLAAELSRPQSYAAFMQRRAAGHSERAAIACGERILTYAQLYAEVAGLAGYLANALGVRRSERVALLLDNGAGYQCWYLAVLAIGAVAVPLNTKLTAREVAFQLGNAGAVAVLSEPRFAAVLEEAQATWIDGTQVGADAQPAFDVASAGVPSDAPAAIYYTSGTTGNPKGVVHTHRSLVAGTLQGPRAWEYDDEQAVTLAMTPLFHIANHTWFLPVLSIGGTMVIDTFRTETVLDLIVRRRVTHVFAVPTMLLLMSQRHQTSRQNLSHVKNVAFGASAMPPEKLTDVRRMFPNARLVHGMGQTESCGTIVTLPAEFAFAKAGSVGVRIDGAEVRVVDEQGRDVPAGVVGELVTRGPNVMARYHEQAEATAAVLAGGWLHTGDLGYLDDDGCLFLVDRKKDMIIRGGENIYSSEVENVLYMHPAVLQAAVVAARSELFGEEVFAFVVKRMEAPEAGTVDEAALRAHCARNLASFKVPIGIAFIDALPQTATGKVQKHRLREMLPAQHR